MLPTRVVLHIGGSKTASTSLQNGVFRHAPSVHHFGEYGDGVTTTVEDQILRSLLEFDEVFYDVEAVRGLFAKHFNYADGGTMMYSSADVLHANQPTLVAHRLHQLVGDEATIFVVVRNQQSALASYYAAHGAWLKPAPRPYYRAFVSFDDWLDQQWLLLPDSRLHTFAYWEQLAPFIKVFGRDRVQVISFENLCCGHMDSWSEIGKLVGLGAEEALSLFRAEHQRRRITKRQLRYGRAMRLLLPFVATPDVRAVRGRIATVLNAGDKFDPSWSPGQLERLAGLYGTGNNHLQRTFDLPLETWNYPGLP